MALVLPVGHDGGIARAHSPFTSPSDPHGPMDVDPYTALAVGYDHVMQHVDYDAWAAYVQSLIDEHGSDVERVIELGGGTGAFALRLQPMGDYTYVLTDGSNAMLERAREKVKAAGAPVRCAQATFTNATLDGLGCSAPVGAVVLLYDGLNYLLEESEVAALFQTVYDLLSPGGIAIVDHSTPANSEAPEGSFVDEGGWGSFSYVRKSNYDPATGRHETIFKMMVDDQYVRECHVQRAYPPAAIRRIVHGSPLEIIAAYDGRTMRPAQEESHRVHWVLRRPTRTDSV